MFESGSKLKVDFDADLIGDGNDRNLRGEVGAAEESEASSSDNLMNSAK